MDHSGGHHNHDDMAAMPMADAASDEMSDHAHHQQHHQAAAEMSMAMAADGQMQHHSMGMMKMYFHGGYDEVILFDFWRISSLGGLLGSMLAVFLMALGYEAVKFAKDRMHRQMRSSSIFGNRSRRGGHNLLQPGSSSSSSNDNNSSPADQTEHDDDGLTTDAVRVEVAGEAGSTNAGSGWREMFSWKHLLLTLINGLQITLAYFLMLVVMTYNTWLCLAVLGGFSVGFFLLGWRRCPADAENDEHCH